MQNVHFRSAIGFAYAGLRKVKRARYHKIFLAAGLAFFTLADFSQAQTAPQDDQSNREEIRRRQQQAQEEQQQRLNQPNVNLEKPAASAPAPALAGKADADGIFVDNESGFFIERVVLDTGKWQFPWLRPIAKKFEGKKINMAGIQQAIHLLTNSFIERGCVTTRVLLPEQDIAATRTLKLLVSVGTVNRVYFTPDSTRRPGGAWWNAFPVHHGKQLNIRDIEQGLEQMKRAPTQDVTMDLKPGAQTSESDIVITRKNAFPIRGSLGIDNSGDKNTGRWQGSATGSWDNPLFLNDVFSFTCNGAVGNSAGQNTRGNNVTYAVPFRYWTAYASYNSYNYRQTVQGFYNPYESSGKSRSMEARLSWLARRDQNTKLSFQSRLTRRNNRNYIDGTELEVQRRDTTALELAMLFQGNSRGAMLDASIAWRCGLPWFDSDTDPAGHPHDAPTFKYRILTANATVRTSFAIASVNFSHQSSLNAQLTGDTLYGSEYFTIGGRYTVRGFDGRQTLGAEKGITLRNELGWPVFKTGQSLYVALDGGCVTGPASHYNSGSTLAGGAIGLRGGWRCFYYDATIGCPLYKPRGLHTGRVTWTAQAGMQF